jgi:hypothetical protein
VVPAWEARAKLPPSAAGDELTLPVRLTKLLRSISGITPRSIRKALASL